MQISQESTCVGVFFNKVAGPQNCNFIKKRLQHRFFVVNFENYSKTPIFCVEDLWTAGSEKPVRLLRTLFFTEHLQWLLLTVPVFQPTALLKKGLQQRCFSVRFAKFLRTSFYWTPPDDCFLCLPVILRSFSDHLFYRAPLGNCLIYVQVAEF